MKLSRTGMRSVRVKWQLSRYSTWSRKKTTLFSGHFLRNRSTLDIGVLGYIGILQHKEHSPEIWHIPPGTLCICLQRHHHVYSYDFRIATHDIQDAIHVYEACSTLKMVVPYGRNTQLQWAINIVPQIASDSLSALEKCTEDVQRSKHSILYFLWSMDRLSQNPKEWLLCLVHLTISL
jgi:hypothetical protein